MGAVFSDLGRAEDAEVLAAYSTGATTGSPAITRNAVGAGAAYYVGTSLTPTGLRDLLGSVLASAGASPTLVPAADVEVVRRTDGSTSWLFVINHSLVDTHVAARGVELIENVAVTGTLVVPAGSVAVVREEVES
jgi:beta-galactosidase